jgi:hypothetical protein
VNQAFTADIFYEIRCVGLVGTPEQATFRLHDEFTNQIDASDVEKWTSMDNGDVCFRRRAKVVLGEFMQLENFPLDVQHLSARISLNCTAEELPIEIDRDNCFLIFDHFRLRQVWTLHKHLSMEVELSDPMYSASKKQYQHVIASVTVTRHPGES